MITFFFSTFAIAGTLFNENLEMHIALVFLLGLFASGRIAVAFIYLMELLTPEWGALVATI